MENTLNVHMRSVLVPLVDERVSIMDRARLGNSFFSGLGGDRCALVHSMLGSDNAWLKACGAFAAGALDLCECEEDLDKCMEHPDALVKLAGMEAWNKLKSRKVGAGAAVPVFSGNRLSA